MVRPALAAVRGTPTTAHDGRSTSATSMARLPQKVWQALRVAARACTMRWGWCGHKELTRTPGLHRRCTELCTRRAAGVLRRGCSLARRTTILRLNTIVLPSGASGLSMRLFASGGAGAAGCALEQMYRSRFEPCDHRARCDPLLTVAHVPSLTPTAHSLAALSHAAQPHIHTSPFMSCCAHPSSCSRGALACANASCVGHHFADRVARTQMLS